MTGKRLVTLNLMYINSVGKQFDTLKSHSMVKVESDKHYELIMSCILEVNYVNSLFYF